jgi:hypothetical protein
MVFIFYQNLDNHVCKIWFFIFEDESCKKSFTFILHQIYNYFTVILQLGVYSGLLKVDMMELSFRAASFLPDLKIYEISFLIEI